MITFKYVRWKNFLSTGNAWTEIKLNKSKSTLIVGENGAGKSTILDALSYALFSKPFRKINKTQLINSINGKGTEVQVDFSIGSNEYRIERAINKYGSSKFEIYKNDKLVDQSANARDYQEMLERNILKLNHKSFSQIVVLGSATFMPFMQLSAQNRREVIEDILDIQIFSTMNVLLREKVAANKDKLNDVVYQCDLIKEKIELQRRHIESLKKDTDKRISQHKQKIQQCSDEIDQHNTVVEGLNAQIEQLQESISDKASLKKKKEKIEQLEYKISDKIKTLEKEITFYEHYDECPTCKQDLDSMFVEKKVETQKFKLEETSAGFASLQQEYQKITDRMQQIQDVQQQINDLLSEVNTNTSHINALYKLQGSIEQEITELQQETGTDNDESGRLKQLEDQLTNVSSERESLSIQKSVYDIAQLILKDSGIKTKIIRQYVPVMNKLINKYLAAMDFFVQFELDESFNETIKSRFRDEFSYASFSEGEKMRIDLALLFTWRAIAKLRNSVSTNLLIMDEVFDSSLDSNGTEEFLKIIGELTSDANVFIISHKGDQLYDKFHSVIKFEKHKNFSRIAA
jgi:DNA repair exonuclease SbcCD ATPase subunit